MSSNFIPDPNRNGRIGVECSSPLVKGKVKGKPVDITGDTVRVHFLRYGYFHQKDVVFNNGGGFADSYSTLVYKEGKFKLDKSVEPWIDKGHDLPNLRYRYGDKHNFKAALTTLRDGYLYVFDQDHTYLFYEFKVINGEIYPIVWDDNNRDIDGNVLDQRTKLGAKRNGWQLHRGRSMWVAFSLVQWSYRYHQKVLFNINGLRDKRCTSFVSNSYPKFDDFNEKKTKDLNLESIKLVHPNEFIRTPDQKGYEYKEGARTLQFQQSLNRLAVEEQKNQKNTQTEYKNDLFVVLEDQIGAMLDLEEYFNDLLLYFTSYIKAIQTGQVPLDVFTKEKSEGNQIQTMDTSLLTQEQKEISEMFNFTAQIAKFLRKPCEKSERYNDAVKKNYINKILDTEMRYGIRSALYDIKYAFAVFVRNERFVEYAHCVFYDFLDHDVTKKAKIIGKIYALRMLEVIRCNVFAIDEVYTGVYTKPIHKIREKKERKNQKDFEKIAMVVSNQESHPLHKLLRVKVDLTDQDDVLGDNKEELDNFFVMATTSLKDPFYDEASVKNRCQILNSCTFDGVEAFEMILIPVEKNNERVFFKYYIRPKIPLGKMKKEEQKDRTNFEAYSQANLYAFWLTMGQTAITDTDKVKQKRRGPKKKFKKYNAKRADLKEKRAKHAKKIDEKYKNKADKIVEEKAKIDQKMAEFDNVEKQLQADIKDINNELGQLDANPENYANRQSLQAELNHKRSSLTENWTKRDNVYHSMEDKLNTTISDIDQKIDQFRSTHSSEIAPLQKEIRELHVELKDYRKVRRNYDWYQDDSYYRVITEDSKNLWQRKLYRFMESAPVKVFVVGVAMGNIVTGEYDGNIYVDGANLASNTLGMIEASINLAANLEPLSMAGKLVTNDLYKYLGPASGICASVALGIEGGVLIYDHDIDAGIFKLIASLATVGTVVPNIFTPVCYVVMITALLLADEFKDDEMEQFLKHLPFGKAAEIDYPNYWTWVVNRKFFEDCSKHQESRYPFVSELRFNYMWAYGWAKAGIAHYYILGKGFSCREELPREGLLRLCKETHFIDERQMVSYTKSNELGKFVYDLSPIGSVHGKLILDKMMLTDFDFRIEAYYNDSDFCGINDHWKKLGGKSDFMKFESKKIRNGALTLEPMLCNGIAMISYNLNIKNISHKFMTEGVILQIAFRHKSSKLHLPFDEDKFFIVRLQRKYQVKSEHQSYSLDNFDWAEKDGDLADIKIGTHEEFI